MKKVFLILLIAFALATAAINIYLEFVHIEYTRAKLFLQYWPLFLVEIIVIVTLYLITFKNDLTKKRW